jgi:hypothetical protein
VAATPPSPVQGTPVSRAGPRCSSRGTGGGSIATSAVHDDKYESYDVHHAEKSVPGADSARHTHALLAQPSGCLTPHLNCGVYEQVVVREDPWELSHDVHRLPHTPQQGEVTIQNGHPSVAAHRTRHGAVGGAVPPRIAGARLLHASQHQQSQGRPCPEVGGGPQCCIVTQLTQLN